MLTGRLACSRMFSTCCHQMGLGHKFNSPFHTLPGPLTTNYHTQASQPAKYAHPHIRGERITHRRGHRRHREGKKSRGTREQKEKMTHLSGGLSVFCFPESDETGICVCRCEAELSAVPHTHTKCKTHQEDSRKMSITVCTH